MLRKASADAASADSVRIKIQTTGDDTVTLPGYTFTQESQDF